MEIQIGLHRIGENNPTYFIADISANHDGDIERAKDLIHLAGEAGADAAKFQNFHAPKIVSDFGFKAIGNQVSHQATWSRSVFEVSFQQKGGHQCISGPRLPEILQFEQRRNTGFPGGTPDTPFPVSSRQQRTEPGPWRYPREDKGRGQPEVFLPVGP